jgi:hypothetical protein
MKKLYLFLGVMAFVFTASSLLFARSLVPFWERTENTQAETTALGITVHGHGVPGWIENRNPFPVRIRSTWVFNGERDRWTRVIRPGERNSDNPCHQVLYHIYRLDDSQEMGIVYSTANGPVSSMFQNPFQGLL